MKTEPLIEMIRDAFKDVEYPGDDNIMPHPHDWDCQHDLAILRGKRWQELSAANLFALLAPSAMTYEAFHYYLPAYLIQALTDLGELDTAFNSIVWDLSPPPYSNRTMEEFLARTRILTEPQRDVIRLFFEWARTVVWDGHVTSYWDMTVASDSNKVVTDRR
jgi:hypothetical protein